ncbi:MAG: CapA family protein [Acidimicrobiales bacterium]
MKLALAGDTMLGRTVAERIGKTGPGSLFADEVVAAAREADLFVLNLECAISERGERWPDPAKPFFFRAPPVAVDALAKLGVDCVTLANNHALDYGADALADTIRHLAQAGIATVGAGPDHVTARAPAVLEHDRTRVGVIGITDHPAGYAAGPGHPGVAYADLRRGTPDWLLDTTRGLDTDIVVVTPHWGPNMVAAPVPHVRRTANDLVDAGATVVAGHSAHVFHGAAGHVLFDLGDFIDDYVVHPELRNDLGLLFLLTITQHQPVRLEAVPLALDYCHTRLAAGDDRRWIAHRFRTACAAFDTKVTEQHGRLVIDWDSPVPQRESPG